MTEQDELDRIKAMVFAWTYYCKKEMPLWRELVAGITPKETDSGLVYEIEPNPLGRDNESFAIVEMPPIAPPHYHKDGEFEIYIGLEGTGQVVVGGKVEKIEPGGLIITEPNTAHFTVSQGLVLAVINTPPFNPGNVVPLTTDNPAVGYSNDQFLGLTAI